jgi:hemerythrin
LAVYRESQNYRYTIRDAKQRFIGDEVESNQAYCGGIMVLIKWSPSLSVRIDEMDKQHQTLLEIMNRLHESISAGNWKESSTTIIGEMVDYTRRHFSAEEQLMEKFRFPQLSGHKTEHAKFTEEVLTFQRRLQSGQTVSAYEILSFLRQWLLTHIQESDTKYGKFINQILEKIAIKV